MSEDHCVGESILGAFPVVKENLPNLHKYKLSRAQIAEQLSNSATMSAGRARLYNRNGKVSGKRGAGNEERETGNR